MPRLIRASTIAMAAVWALPAHAAAPESAAIEQELAAMRAQMAQMAARIDTLEGQLAAEKAKEAANGANAAASVAASATPPAPTPNLAAPGIAAKPATELAWDGAPRLTTRDGWSFKPRGRLQLDVGSLSAPTLLDSKDKGVATEFRRAYLGFEGTMPGNFGYRVDVDFANSAVSFADFYLTYKPTPKVTLWLGNQKPLLGIEEMTFDLYVPFMERASYTTAFGFERRVGLSAWYENKALLLQGGVFADDPAALNTSTNNSFSLDGRVVFMPKIGSAQLHIGGSAHYRKFNDLTDVASYSTRPFIHTTDLRLVNTGNITNATGERGFGGEFAYIAGRFHATAESFWQTTLRNGLPNPTFNGGYAELGYLLTDDSPVYASGQFGRMRPKHPMGKDGFGTVQVNLRYDWLDLDSGAILGGRQQIAGLSVLWIPVDHVRMLLNYGHIWLDDAAKPAGSARKYNADALGLRTQFDF